MESESLRLSPTTKPKIQDLFVLWVALQAKVSIHIRYLLQQQDQKENHFSKWVSRREDVYIWIVSLRQPKIGLVNFRSTYSEFDAHTGFSHAHGFHHVLTYALR